MRLLRGSALAVLVSVSLAVAGCGVGSSAGKGEKTIGVSFYSVQIPLYAQMAGAMKDEAGKLGVGLEIKNGDFTAATQASQIDSLVSQRVDLVAATPLSAEALVPAYQRVQAAGIPILSFANKVDDKYENAFVGQSWDKFGEMLVDKAAAAVGGKGKVLLVHGPKGADYEVGFDQGLKRGLAKYPGLVVAAEPYNINLSIPDAVGLVSSALGAHPDINVILGDDDSSALGAVQAIEDRGLTRKNVYVAGFGGYPSTIDAMREQKGPDFTISLKGDTWGRQVIQTAVDYLNGKKPAQHLVESAYQEVTAQNVNTLTAAQLN